MPEMPDGLTITGVVRGAHENSRDKGWWDAQTDGPPEQFEGKPPLVRSLVLTTVPEKLCLIHSEVSEALEAFRDGQMGSAREGEKPVGFGSELADIVIRVADLAAALGIPLEQEVERKMAYNRTRPHRHGGKAC